MRYVDVLERARERPRDRPTHDLGPQVGGDVRTALHRTTAWSATSCTYPTSPARLGYPWGGDDVRAGPGAESRAGSVQVQVWHLGSHRDGGPVDPTGPGRRDPPEAISEAPSGPAVAPYLVHRCHHAPAGLATDPRSVESDGVGLRRSLPSPGQARMPSASPDLTPRHDGSGRTDRGVLFGTSRPR